MSTAELCALAEEHVPGLFRSKTQLREIVELLRKQRKVMLPGGRYICRSLYLVEKERRRKEFLASRERRVGAWGLVGRAAAMLARLGERDPLCTQDGGYEGTQKPPLLTDTVVSLAPSTACFASLVEAF